MNEGQTAVRYGKPPLSYKSDTRSNRSNQKDKWRFGMAAIWRCLPAGHRRCRPCVYRSRSAWALGAPWNPVPKGWIYPKMFDRRCSRLLPWIKGNIRPYAMINPAQSCRRQRQPCFGLAEKNSLPAGGCLPTSRKCLGEPICFEWSARRYTAPVGSRPFRAISALRRDLSVIGVQRSMTVL